MDMVVIFSNWGGAHGKSDTSRGRAPKWAKGYSLGPQVPESKVLQLHDYFIKSSQDLPMLGGWIKKMNLQFLSNNRDPGFVEKNNRDFRPMKNI